MRRSPINWQQIPSALHQVYRDRRYLLGATSTSLLCAILLGWTVGLVTFVQGLGLFWDMMPLRLVQVLVVAGSLGLLLPMQVYVLRKGRQRAMPASRGEQRPDKRAVGAASQAIITVLGGGVSVVLGVACLVCCAPLLIPAGLALLGTSGIAILSLTVEQGSGWLFLLSLVLGFPTLLLVAHNVTAACGLHSGRGRET